MAAKKKNPIIDSASWKASRASAQTSPLPAWLLGLLLGLFTLTTLGSIIFFSLFKDRIYPGIYIDQISVAGLTREQALSLLEGELGETLEYQITVGVDDIVVASSSADLGLERKTNEAVNNAFEIGRVGFPITRMVALAKTLFSPYQLSTNLSYDSTKLLTLAQVLKNKVDYAGATPSAKLKFSGSPGSLIINPGEYGRSLNLEKTAQEISSGIGLEQQEFAATVASTSSQLDDQQIEAAEERAKQLVKQQIVLRTEDIRLKLNDQDLISLLTFPEGFSKSELQSLAEEWQEVVERQPENAKFIYDPGTLLVQEFNPGKKGLSLQQEKLTDLLTTNIEELIADPPEVESSAPAHVTELALPVITTDPQVKLADTNNLGIKERIGFGESEYDHSIPTRIHNVAHTTNRINNTIIEPGEEFSFNQTLGDVSRATGFKPAYVIKDGATVLGDGGGVCQVSTTTFRAALNAGLPITRRLQHSYRVSYYELNAKPGIDATVYSDNIDLRFVNDTDHHILINGETDSNDLYMNIEIYGTSDGRTTEITDHEVWGYRPPPASVYIPDPSMAPGQKKQVDWAVAGIKARFKNIVRDKDGELIREEEYYSSYIPWSAKYLVGE